MTADLTAQPGPELADPDLDEPRTDTLEVVPGRFDVLRSARVSGRAVDLGVLVVALVVGSWLRLADLGGVGVNSDEAVYAGQAASLAGNDHFLANFPIVRAHPLLFQMLIAPWYADGVPDTAGRYASALFGIGTIALVFALGHLLYGRRAGAIAALLVAVMPFAVILNRQVLLDGPMTFFTTAALVCLALLAKTENGRWLVAAGALLGLATLTKETAVIMVMAVFVFLSLVPRFWRPKRYVVLAVVAALGLAATYPIATALAGGGSRGQSYIVWQLSRRPNHDFLFYLTDIPVAIGVLTIVTAGVGLVLLRRRSSWREVLLLAWIIVPFVFFEVWPVKGFPYLLVLAPAVAVLAARACAALIDRSPRRAWSTVTGVVLTAALVLVTFVPSAQLVIDPVASPTAGAGGSPGGREAGIWIDANVPSGAKVMTIGPTMANIVMYYSGRRADALSVSPNPLHRNPSYSPIINPDHAVRAGTYRYLVWDAYSAARSPSFSSRLLGMVRKYGGRVVHSESAVFDGTMREVVVIYEVKR